MDETTSTEMIHVIPRCGNCQSDDLRMPEGITTQDALTDDSILTCANCGTTTTYAALVEVCEADIAKDIESDFMRSGDLLD